MQIVTTKNGNIVAMCDDDQRLDALYPTYTITCLKANDVDPRTAVQKLTYFREQRRKAYPPIGDQLDMMYHDKLDGTSTWMDAILAVKTKIPKPKV